MEKTIKINSTIELIEDGNEAFAQISLNPYFQWAKIIVTDDQPNGNKQRIPKEQFPSIVKTGINAPVKMDYGKITGHEEAKGKPIGVIAQLTEEANRVIALAALWKFEREDDIAMLKDMYLKGTPPQVSWELSYAEEKLNEDGITDLIDPALFGLVVVENPAYTGRTAFVAMSSKTSTEETSVNEEEYKAKIKELEDLLVAKTKELEESTKELATLRDYKASIEKKETEEKRFSEIQKKFKEAKIEKEDAYFAEKKEFLLGLSDAQLDFVIQELVAFAAKLAEAELNDPKKPKVPPITGDSSEDLSDPKKLAQALRERNKK